MAKRATLNVSLTPQMLAQVNKWVKSGQFQSSSEVMRAALRDFSERQQARNRAIKTLQREVRKGQASIDQGRIVDGEGFMRQWEEADKAKAPMIRARRRSA